MDRGVVHDWIGRTVLAQDRTGGGCSGGVASLVRVLPSSLRSSARPFELRARVSLNSEVVEDRLAVTGDVEAASEFNVLAYGHGDLEGAKRRLESRLRSRIEQVDRVCKINEEQRNKLSVAGRGDIKRAFARAEELMAGMRVLDLRLAENSRCSGKLPSIAVR